MLGLFLIYFIGKAFYDLAGLNNKNKWGFAVLGVVSYYGGTAIGGVIIALLAEFQIFFDSVDDIPDMLLNLLALPFGVLICWLTYRYLQNTWSRAADAKNSEVLDGDLMQ